MERRSRASAFLASVLPARLGLKESRGGIGGTAQRRSRRRKLPRSVPSGTPSDGGGDGRGLPFPSAVFWITDDITCKEKDGVTRNERANQGSDLGHWTVSAAVLIKRGLVLVENGMREQFLRVPNQVSSG